MTSDPGQRVAVALDFDSAEAALALVGRLGDAATFYKVGLQLLTAAGPAPVQRLVAAGKQVYLDLKLHEIPHSVAAGVAAAGRLGVSMVTVHAFGGTAVLRAAAEAARPFPGLRVLALTVITSMSDADLHDIGVPGLVADQVVRLAQLAARAGCDGVVASPQEAALLRGVLPAGALVVTPGIQLPGDAATDQARIATPRDAILAGATHVVIGRSVARAADPAAAFGAACAQVQEALARRHP